MILHLAHMLSRRGMRRLLWAVLLLLPITIAIRHPYAPYLCVCRSGTVSGRRPRGPRMASCAPPSDGLKGIAPRLLRRLRPLIEIGEVHDSLHKEPSAGSSTGELSLATEGRRDSWTRCGPGSTPAKSSTE